MLKLDKAIDHLQVEQSMLPRHGAKMPVADARHPRRGISRLLSKELLEIVHRHGLQDLGKINLVTLVQNRSQLRRDHRMISKRIAQRKLGVRCFRAPSQGFWEQVLHMP